MSDIRVKLVSKYSIDAGRLACESMPGVQFVSGDCQYDWLVVYDDFPSVSGEALSLGSEQIACAPERTILLTYEPSSIKFYGSDYVRQFAHVLTSHDTNALQHPNRTSMPPVGIWYYGDHSDAAELDSPPVKTHDCSIFYSNKTMQHSLHDLRHQFIRGLMSGMSEQLDVYGRGYRPVAKKKAALDPYRYHIAIENHRGDHHWTEKLSDCYLGYCLPVYTGCSNLAAYFPEESYLEVDPRDIDYSIGVIRRAISSHLYEKSLPAIETARKLVLSDYSLGTLLSRYILQAEASMGALPVTHVGTKMIRSRHLLMRYRPLAFFRYAVGKMMSRVYHRKKWRAYRNGVTVNS